MLADGGWDARQSDGKSGAPAVAELTDRRKLSTERARARIWRVSRSTDARTSDRARVYATRDSRSVRSCSSSERYPSGAPSVAARSNRPYEQGCSATRRCVDASRAVSRFVGVVVGDD